MDDYLMAIVRAAEAGLECPPLRILVGNAAVWGVPRPSAEFIEVSREPLLQQYQAALRSRPRHERKANYSDPAELADGHLQNVRWPKEDPANAITLLHVNIWPWGGGDGLELPALRIPLDAVDAWWIAGGTALEAEQRFEWFFGETFFLPGR